MHINHMQKALVEMNIRLPEVLSQVQGVSGLAIIEAILSGERDPHKLVSLCQKDLIRRKGEELLKALEGYYSPVGLFSLEQAYQGFKFYRQQVASCDQKIQECLQRNQTDLSDIQLDDPRKPIRHNKPQVEDLGKHLLKLFEGKDATKLSGITDYSWFQLYTETGADLSRWPTEKHFTSWLGLSPGQNHSGKQKRSKSKGVPKTGQIFRMTARSLLQSKKIALGEFGRRLRARKGTAVAIKAVARKLAEQYWRLMVKGQEFVEYGIQHYHEKLQAQKKKYILRLAAEMKMDFNEG